MPQNRVQGCREWIVVREYKAIKLESMVKYGGRVEVLRARMVELWVRNMWSAGWSGRLCGYKNENAPLDFNRARIV
ncbi:hypothetical protein DM141_02740 [Shigella sonnei]|nr:hypothetical protein [Shigella sonnei]